jgi:hypothetical protein
MQMHALFGGHRDRQAMDSNSLANFPIARRAPGQPTTETQIAAMFGSLCLVLQARAPQRVVSLGLRRGQAQLGVANSTHGQLSENPAG